LKRRRKEKLTGKRCLSSFSGRGKLLKVPREQKSRQKMIK
jgi:hypothetical protein